MTELTARNTKLVQYLNEAYGKEKQLETALEAHIAMTTRAPYKKRLQQHLTETKRHGREVERRIKQLGGQAEIAPLPGPDTLARGASAAVELGSRAIAAVQGPLHAIRGIGEQERMLKNAKTEYAEEHEEIATYTAIETLAETVGDTDTAKLARAIRREEQSMASFLERQIPALTKAVTQEEIPAAERRTGSPRRRRSSGSRSTAKRATTAVKRKTTAVKRKTTTAKRATTAAKRKTTAVKRKTTTAKRTRTAAKRKTTAVKRKTTTAKRNTRAATRAAKPRVAKTGARTKAARGASRRVASRV
jgi:ferritin-like metal-binding protein YciE